MFRRPTAIALVVVISFAIASPVGASVATATTTSGVAGTPTPVPTATQPVDLGGPHVASADGSADRDAPRIVVTAVRTPDGPGPAYRVSITALDSIDALWVSTTDATVDGSSGVRRSAEGHRFTWDGTADAVRVTVTPDTAPTDGSLAVAGEDWSFGPVPPLLVAWQTAGGEVRQVRPFEEDAEPFVTVESSDGGLVGEKYALVGRSRVATTATDRGDITLVVPSGVQPRPSAAAVLMALDDAAATFDDGAGPDDAVVFVLPPTVRSGGATFVRSDETWITADSWVRTANSVWFHEYVHTRQNFDLGPRMRWFQEASAEYFGARLALETGQVSSLEYEAYLLGRQHSASVLTRPETWATDVPYHRGAVVLAALDEKIRTRTDGKHSLADVFARLNRHEGTVTYPVFVAVVNDVAGENMGPWLDRTVAGRASVGGPAGVTWLFEGASQLAAVARTIPLGPGLLVGVGAALAVQWRS